jgi:hypothetical protein
MLVRGKKSHAYRWAADSLVIIFLLNMAGFRRSFVNMQARIVMSLTGTHENREADDGDDRFC